ncbi:membrane-spanning 4-domains subfamily A member 4A-like [Astatotilapia calliptera]|uniref:membrane-spanning 4-domains subfamily A member 4A-like n=1 Tax=Astatotilapia calliptera TaxID=8154 RepID=UPI000E405403|nr:membrane-spanning 4-domains subfamily A member 4A-like [Astatotilapia calliptera]
MFPLRLYVFLQVIQIMVALTVMVFGILRATRSKGLVSDSLVYIWGPVLFIIAGCMNIYDGTSERRSGTHLCDITIPVLQVRGALGANVIAAVTSAAAIIIYILEAFWPHYAYHYYGSSYLNTSTPDWSFTHNYERFNSLFWGF